MYLLALFIFEHCAFDCFPGQTIVFLRWLFSTVCFKMCPQTWGFTSEHCALDCFPGKTMLYLPNSAAHHSLILSQSVGQLFSRPPPRPTPLPFYPVVNFALVSPLRLTADISANHSLVHPFSFYSFYPRGKVYSCCTFIQNTSVPMSYLHTHL